MIWDLGAGLWNEYCASSANLCLKFLTPILCIVSSLVSSLDLRVSSAEVFFPPPWLWPYLSARFPLADLSFPFYPRLFISLCLPVFSVGSHAPWLCVAAVGWHLLPLWHWLVNFSSQTAFTCNQNIILLFPVVIETSLRCLMYLSEI